MRVYVCSECLEVLAITPDDGPQLDHHQHHDPSGEMHEGARELAIAGDASTALAVQEHWRHARGASDRFGLAQLVARFPSDEATELLAIPRDDADEDLDGDDAHDADEDLDGDDAHDDVDGPDGPEGGDGAPKPKRKKKPAKRAHR